MKKFQYLNKQLSDGNFCLFIRNEPRYTFKYDFKNGWDSQDRLIYPISHDLMNVAYAVYLMDRCSYISDKDKKRKIEANVEVNAPGFFNSKIKKKINDLLNWVTGDIWDIRYSASQVYLYASQPILPYKVHSDRKIFLWSGGLDALAGLYHQMKVYPKSNFIPVHIGFNKNMQGKQEKLWRNLLHNSKGHEQPYQFEVSFSTSNIDRQDKLNDTCRTRGFCFLMFASAVAISYNVQKVYMYENGYGAFNIPYTASETASNQSKSAHPKLLTEVAKIVSDFTETQFTIQNPYIFKTKAQMLNPLIQDGAESLIFDSVSCDSPRRVEGIAHCGVCSSCILRRIALNAAGLKNEEKYAVSIIKEPEFFKVFLKQARELSSLIYENEGFASFIQEKTELYDVLWALQEHGMSQHQIEKQVIRLYKKHIKETHKFISVMAPKLTEVA